MGKCPRPAPLFRHRPPPSATVRHPRSTSPKCTPRCTFARSSSPIQRHSSRRLSQNGSVPPTWHVLPRPTPVGAAGESNSGHSGQPGWGQGSQVESRGPGHAQLEAWRVVAVEERRWRKTAVPRPTQPGPPARDTITDHAAGPTVNDPRHHYFLICLSAQRALREAGRVGPSTPSSLL